MTDVSQMIPSLNGIRAISVLIVVLSHAGLGTIVPGGLGVTTFFFLSGYLITTLMISEFQQTGSLDVSGFYARRILRLMPPLAVTLAIAYALVATGFLPGATTFNGLAAQLLYFANYYSLYFDPGNVTIPAGTGILWSLAIEEHFYLLYPVVMLAFLKSRLSQKRIAIILAITCIVILLWRIELVQHNATESRTYYASDTRIDSIIFGALMALWVKPAVHARRSMSPMEWALLATGFALLLMTLVYRDAAFRETYRYSLQGIALLPIFYFSIRFHDNLPFRFLNSTLMNKLGVWSYSIYLIHYVLINAIVANWPSFSNRAFSLFAVTIALACCYAAVIDRFIDPPFRILRRRFHLSRSKCQTYEN